MTRVFLLTLLLAAGCSAGPMTADAPADARADQATQHACRARANEVYDRRNRAEIFAANTSINTPFSGNYGAGTTNRYLSEQFSFDRSVDECVRNAGTGADRSAAAAPPPVVKKR